MEDTIRYWGENKDEVNYNFEQAYEEEMNKINKQLEEEILFTLIGNVNSGKSSTINLLMGYEVSKAGAKPGETTQIDEYKYADNIIFADTPGLEDINKDNSEKTLGYYKKSDAILFFLNAAGEVLSSNEKKIFDKIKLYNDSIIIVLNKIDAAEDIPQLINYISNNLGHNYKIIPISSKTGQNIDVLRKEILELLEVKKKDLLFAKYLREKSPIANKWILGAATSAGAIGVIPIPGSDIVPITMIQMGLLLKLSILYEIPISKENAKDIIITGITGNAGKMVFKQILKLFPGYGSIIGGSVASTMTFALGQSVKYAYENGIEIDGESIKDIYNMLLKKEKSYQPS